MDVQFTLLTHSKEIGKRSNTGRIVRDVLGDEAELICWVRNSPPAELVRQIEAGGTALVYPGAADGQGDDLSRFNRFILIDGTWHEVRKIHQRSPYLLKAPRVGLRPAGVSRYNLRKNQKVDGLCTAECVIQILRETGRHELAARLEERFLAFMKPLQEPVIPVPDQRGSQGAEIEPAKGFDMERE